MKTTTAADGISSVLPCQIYSVPKIAEPSTPFDLFRHVRNRLARFLKRRCRYLVNRCARTMTDGTSGTAEAGRTAAPAVCACGDMVRVRSVGEIMATLDNWNKLRGCAFMEEMQPYCGTVQRIRKRVETFLDERDYRTKRCRGIVILDDVMCQGTRDFGACDRSCFFFWREEWVEKL